MVEASHHDNAAQLGRKRLESPRLAFALGTSSPRGLGDGRNLRDYGANGASKTQRGLQFLAINLGPLEWPTPWGVWSLKQGFCFCLLYSCLQEHWHPPASRIAYRSNTVNQKECWCARAVQAYLEQLNGLFGRERRESKALLIGRHWRSLWRGSVREKNRFQCGIAQTSKLCYTAPKC